MGLYDVESTTIKSGKSFKLLDLSLGWSRTRAKAEKRKTVEHKLGAIHRTLCVQRMGNMETSSSEHPLFINEDLMA
ncbi:MAG: hypothetical protein M1830_004953 [Pleopsidium flavum]|nr:MAG: hypothetical protein M1830_004953 [Pleopsidium flavum]